MKLLPLLLVASALASEAYAHSGHAPTGTALHRRQAHNQLVQRSIQKRCGAVLAKRRANRLRRREEQGHQPFAKGAPSGPSSNFNGAPGPGKKGGNTGHPSLTNAPATTSLISEITSYSSSAISSVISNTTLSTNSSTDDGSDGVCILTPEVTQGPYHILGELVRQNITENQPGVPFEVDIDFIDIATCEPVSKVWVDSWHCNSTGYYSGYTGSSLAIGGGGGGPGNGTGNGTAPNGVSSGAIPSGSGAPSGSGTPGNGTGSPTQGGDLSTATGAYAGADSAGSTLGNAPTDEESFLRGVWQADDDGHITIYSTVPGWYSGRSTHFHVKVYTADNGSIADNGTFIAGSALHTGQFFFADEFMEKIGNLTPYNTNTVERTTNDEDTWFAYENAEGYDALLDIAQVSDNLADGVIGSITVGLNLTYTSPEIANYWWTGGNSN